MQLTDKRFWKFEAIMLLCGVILLCQMLVALLCNEAEFESCNGAVLILLFPALCLYFVISGIPTWLLYKGNSWLRLAGYLYLISALLLIVPLFIFLFDWNPITANMRPGNIPADEGKYFTDNELIIMICAGWAAMLIIPVLITSYLTKCWIMRPGDEQIEVKNFCPVCGYPLGDYNPWGDDGKTPTYDICPCCGVEWGNEDYTPESRKEYRNKWIAVGAKWFDPQKKPANWNLEKQLRNIGYNETD